MMEILSEIRAKLAITGAHTQIKSELRRMSLLEKCARCKKQKE